VIQVTQMMAAVALEPLRQIRPVQVAAQGGGGHCDQRLMVHNPLQLRARILIRILGGLLHFDRLKAQRQTGGGLLLILIRILLPVSSWVIQFLFLLGNLHIQWHFAIALFGLLLILLLIGIRWVVGCTGCGIAGLAEHHSRRRATSGGQRRQLLVTGSRLGVGYEELQVLGQVVFALPAARLGACQFQGSEETAPYRAPPFATVAHWKSQGEKCFCSI